MNTKRLLLLFFFLSWGGISALQAQEANESPWFAEGSKWCYSIADDGMGSGVGCIRMSVAGDTLLGERVCKRLKIESCDGSYETSYEYVYPEGEKLFYYNVAVEDFFLLLDLSAKPGDTVWVHTEAFTPNPGFDPYQRWKLYRDPSDSFRFMAYRITAIDSVSMGGKMLKRQAAQPLTERKTDNGEEDSYWHFPGWHQEYIIEGIGSMGGFFGEVQGLYPEWGKCRLRCFFADGKTYLTDGNCGETANETGKADIGIKIYPNPAGETITLTTTGCNLQKVEILDVNGRVLYAATLDNQTSFRYNVSWMPSGIYLARVKTPCGVLTEKFSVR
ncbi:MAG: T9SS type A sorting domain-containing protein [Bacteroides sp.]|nr:T9SS type A sorting domain-containing protein [Bacteroides sp.]MCM1084913.1 T9SS type A sorting domain-containing protein [Bacteroides sp.]